MQLPKHLKQYRLDAGLSQEDLARRIFVTRQTISNWERGKTYPVTRVSYCCLNNWM